MSSAYGNVSRPLASLPTPFTPITTTLSNHHLKLIAIPKSPTHFTIPRLTNIFNRILRDGDTYPFWDEHTDQQFYRYFVESGDAFCVVDDMDGDNKDDVVVYGAFYIKPNFPGRCSHICNGGFIVANEHRGKGIGRFMGDCFLKIAPSLGYKSAMFNLVFVTNEASVKLWRGLGFRELGTIPNAGKLKLKNSEKEEFVDAIMFYYDFDLKILR